MWSALLLTALLLCVNPAQADLHARWLRTSRRIPSLTPVLRSGASSVCINEIHYENVGTDEGEGIEVRAPAGTDLTGWTLVFYNGNDNAVYRTETLSGTVSNAVSGVGFLAIALGSNKIQNGPSDGIALVDPAGTVVQFICYEGTLTAADGPAAGTLCTDIGVRQSGTTAVGSSPQLTGCDGEEFWTTGTASFGEVNVGQSFPPNFVAVDPPDFAPIFEIQGTGLESPLVGQQVRTAGVVTAVDTNGFYLQDAAGDEDDATSDALFVFRPGASGVLVSVGDEVSVIGIVSEFVPGGVSSRNQGTTQVTATVVEVLSSGNALPEPVRIGNSGRSLPKSGMTAGIAFWESLEGMRVLIVEPKLVAPSSPFGEYFVVADGGQFATVPSGRGSLVLTKSDFNPEIIEIDGDSGVFSYTAQELRPGATLSDVVGVVSFSFGRYEIIPTEAFQASDATLAQEETALVSKRRSFTIASFNLKNFVRTDESGSGRASNIASIIVQNMKSPDILALQEVLDDSREEPGTIEATQNLQLLVDAIAAAGGPTYTAQDNPYIGDGTNGGIPNGNIRVVFLFNPDRVSLTETLPVVDPQQQQNGETAFARSRPPLAAVFSFREKQILVVNVHFSSKFGSAPTFGTEQPVESRQDDPAVNGAVDDRMAQATAVKAFLDGSTIANQVVLGDMNDFYFSGPVKAMTPLKNLVRKIPKRERYTLYFGGNAQMLDHILVSPNLRNGSRFDIVHAVMEFPGSESDHEPILARLKPT